MLVATGWFPSGVGTCSRSNCTRLVAIGRREAYAECVGTSLRSLPDDHNSRRHLHPHNDRLLSVHSLSRRPRSQRKGQCSCSVAGAVKSLKADARRGTDCRRHFPKSFSYVWMPLEEFIQICCLLIADSNYNNESWRLTNENIGIRLSKLLYGSLFAERNSMWRKSYVIVYNRRQMCRQMYKPMCLLNGSIDTFLRRAVEN